MIPEIENPEAVLALIGAVIVVLTVFVMMLRIAVRRAPLKPRKASFQKRWRDLQKFCADKKTWPDALVAADKLLDRALLKRGYKGKSMGERLVNAQKVFSDNDDVWFAHKLAKKAAEDPDIRLKEGDVKNALVVFGQALQDLGALSRGQTTKANKTKPTKQTKDKEKA